MAFRAYRPRIKLVSKWKPAVVGPARRLGATHSVRRPISGSSRCLTSQPETRVHAKDTALLGMGWDKCKQLLSLPQSSKRDDYQLGNQITVHGWLQKRRDQSSKRSFVDLQTPATDSSVQILSEWQDNESPEHALHKTLKSITSYSPVAVTGEVIEQRLTKVKTSEQALLDTSSKDRTNVLIRLKSIKPLNHFPKDIIVSDGVVFPPTARHLQMRFSPTLRKRLVFRDHVAREARHILAEDGFAEVETPILFKSTPEGAREFLVPTRRSGLAYALPQSPQQYKQILMATGITKYFQVARCFRDEDLRADRQPEFTQLDLEMAFVTGQDVIAAVESLVRRLYSRLSATFDRQLLEGEFVPSLKGAHAGPREGTIVPFPELSEEAFLRWSYEEAMSKHGSDKPDLRIPAIIQRIDHILPPDFVKKISHLDNPVVDACRFRLEGSPTENWKFATEFWSRLPSKLGQNPDGQPVVMVYDSTKPLGGLSVLGHEVGAALTDPEAKGLDSLAPLEEGDILIIQARPNIAFQGGSTALGTIRTEFYQEAVRQELLPRDDSFKFLWVTGFPMFTPDNDVDPGQGGKAGFSATHHPFTAPLTPEDLDLLATDPLKAKADHYDLVVNGVELGGGSRRIHVAQLQQYIMKHILQMSEEGISHFSHLLEALRAGCPPHAGLALGFDRLVAVLSGTNSVRDVIAFPKNMKGEDMAVKSPGKITQRELDTYHLSYNKQESGANKA